MKIKFVPQDCWVGLYWKREPWFLFRYTVTTWYLCLVPCFPIIWETRKPFSLESAEETIRRMAARSKSK